MDKYRCMMCGHIYDPQKGEARSFKVMLCNSATMELYECKPGDEAKPYISAGTDFSALPNDWVCPTCGYPKSYYQKVVADPLSSMRTINY